MLNKILQCSYIVHGLQLSWPDFYVEIGTCDNISFPITAQNISISRTILPHVLSNILMSPYPGMHLEKKVSYTNDWHRTTKSFGVF